MLFKIAEIISSDPVVFFTVTCLVIAIAYCTGWLVDEIREWK